MIIVITVNSLLIIHFKTLTTHSVSEIPGIHSGAGTAALVATAAAIGVGDKPEITLSKANGDEAEPSVKANGSPTVKTNNNDSKASVQPSLTLSPAPIQDSLGLGTWGQKSPDLKHHFRRHSSGSFMG